MSLKMAADIEALKERIKTLEEALAAKVGATIATVEHATKDDIDALLARLRQFEGRLESLSRKGK